MSKYNINPVIVQQYSIENKVTQKVAREKLRENYDKEINKVDFKKIALRAVDGMRQMSPKLNGLEQREVDTQHKIKQLELGLERVAREVEGIVELRVEVALLKDQNNKNIKLIDRLLSVCEKQNESINGIVEKLYTPWYKRIWIKLNN